MPITNKKYEKFWENEDLDVSTNSDIEQNNDKEIDIKEEVKDDVLNNDSIEKEDEKEDKSKTTTKQKTTKKVEVKTEDKPKTTTKRKTSKKTDVKTEDKSKTTKQKTIKKVDKKVEDVVNTPIQDKKIEKVIEEVKDSPVQLSVKKDVVIVNDNKKETKTKEIKEITLKDIYETFISEQKPFRILHRGTEIFNTKKQVRKDYPTFRHEEFVLFGKRYSFRGIRIEKI